MSVTLPAAGSGFAPSTILQVVSRTQMIPFGSATLAWSNTNLAATITPLSISSTISILVAAYGGTSSPSYGNDSFWRVVEETSIGGFVLNPNNVSGLADPADGGPEPYVWQTAGQSPFASYPLGGNLHSYVRSGTLSSITYILQVHAAGDSGGFLNCRGFDGGYTVASTLTILEISND
jgi:hypothetical protein